MSDQSKTAGGLPMRERREFDGIRSHDNWTSAHRLSLVADNTNALWVHLPSLPAGHKQACVSHERQRPSQEPAQTSVPW